MRKVFYVCLITQIPVLCFSQSVLKSTVVSSKPVLVPSSGSSTKAPVAQPSSAAVKTKASSSDNTSTDTFEVVVVKKTAPAGLDINYLPLFGEYMKTDGQLLEDQMFISDCDRNFKNRSEASDFFAKMAWDYLSEGNKNLAVHRFNLSWLLDKNNPDPFWGWGVIEYQDRKPQIAAKYLVKGLEMSHDPNVSLMVDLATVYISCSLEKSAPEDLTKANDLLNKAMALQPDYINTYMQLTIARIIDNKLDEAWDFFHRGYSISPEEVSVDVLNELLIRAPDPKGIFRKPD